ncbi:hypothetical protein ACFYY5_25980 [Nocardia elegans]|uniref:Rad50/SbcC-type AAA domain-containing protein n=1 Tax=Nocardia elegans TaxID=300029 RepID=A0ABW6TNR3_9NOCA
MNSLRLTYLTFLGADVEAAAVEFGPAVTVIRGPSDTGKSFIVNALDFMLGGSKLKVIPELAGYSTVLLGLVLPSGQRITLSRSVRGGAFGLYEGEMRSLPAGPPPTTLAAAHSAKNSGNLSRYLLSQIGLDDKKVRKNLRNETQSLSFRNLAKLCVISETAMQSEVPPAVSGNPTSRTTEISTLKLLLEGDDDSDLVGAEVNPDRATIMNAKVELIDELIGELEQKTHDVAPIGDVQAQLNRLNHTIARQNSAIAENARVQSVAVRQQAGLQQRVLKLSEQRDDIATLRSRFNLLVAKYDSDLGRLEMIEEAGTFLGFFNPGTCVFCGAEPQHQHPEGHTPQDVTLFGESVRAEHAKTMALRADLVETLRDLDQEHAELGHAIEQDAQSIDTLRRQVDQLEAEIGPQLVDVEALLAKRSELERHIADYAQVDKLNALKVEIATKNQAENTAAVDGLQHGTLTHFSRSIAHRLDAWGFPGANEVRYDRETQDLIAGEQFRSAHGKGVRAILHAAFTIGLAQYCFERDMPHPGFVVLDSPLVTYRAPEMRDADADETLPDDFVTRFYADVQVPFSGQILIMENTDPPNGLTADSVDIQFTGTPGRGRGGFFPPHSSGSAGK